MSHTLYVIEFDPSPLIGPFLTREAAETYAEAMPKPPDEIVSWCISPMQEPE